VSVAGLKTAISAKIAKESKLRRYEGVSEATAEREPSAEILSRRRRIWLPRSIAAIFGNFDISGNFKKRMNEYDLLRAAIAEARLGFSEGGIPIGSVLADSTGKIVSRGHNLRIQTGDPTAHAEVVCIRNAGRRTDWHNLVLVSTLSPCIMCTGTSLLYRIPKVIIGENLTFKGAEDLFAAKGVQLSVLQDRECIEMMRSFIKNRPDIWNEDIGVPPEH